MKKLILLLLFIPLVFSCSSSNEDTASNKYTLTTTANPSDGGKVFPVTKQYNEGETATINANPATEYVFQSWSGASGSSSTASVVMNSDKSVTANFVKKKYALTTSVEGEGTITEKVIKTGAVSDYNSGTLVELTATAKTGWKFKEWTGDLTGTDNPKEITINKAKTVKAVFESIPPFYLDDNGVTVKAREWVTAGLTGQLNGVTYTSVDRDMLISKLSSGEDVSKVVTTLVNSTEGMFMRAHSFNQDISNWDVSNVTNMKNMFRSARSFNKPIGNWNTSAVTTMDMMFSDATVFNQDIGNWDVSNVTNMAEMFGSWFFGESSQGKDATGGITIAFNKDISNWDVSNVTNMTGMFCAAKSFNQDISNWNVEKVDNMGGMFMYSNSFNKNISTWKTGNVMEMRNMFAHTTKFDINLTNWNTSNVKWCTNFNYKSNMSDSNLPNFPATSDCND